MSATTTLRWGGKALYGNRAFLGGAHAVGHAFLTPGGRGRVAFRTKGPASAGGAIQGEARVPRIALSRRFLFRGAIY